MAAASVVITHVFNHSRPDGGAFNLGWFSTYGQTTFHHGVILFFALSGFLLYLPFASAALRDEPRPAIGAYFRNRALRILPAYWFVLFCSALILQSTRNGPGGSVGAITDPGMLALNALLIQNYVPAGLGTGVGAVWSLAVEAAFYLLLPLLVIIGLRLGRRAATRDGRRWALLAPAAIMGIVGIVSVALSIGGLGEEVAGVPSWGRVWDMSIFTNAHLFALGLALAVVRAEYQDGRLRLPSYWRTAAIAALVVLGAVTIELGASNRVPEKAVVGLVALLCGLVLALTTLTGGPERSRLVAVLESRPLIGLGVISYGVFLWHEPVIFFLRDHGLTLNGGFAAFAVNMGATALMTLALAGVTWKLVEKPALRRKASTRSAGKTATISAERSKNATSRDVGPPDSLGDRGRHNQGLAPPPGRLPDRAG